MPLGWITFLRCHSTRAIWKAIPAPPQSQSATVGADNGGILRNQFGRRHFERLAAHHWYLASQIEDPPPDRERFPKPGVRGSSPLRDANNFNDLRMDDRIAVTNEPAIDRTRRAIRAYQIPSVSVRGMTCSLQIDSARHQPLEWFGAPGPDDAVTASMRTEKAYSSNK
jgi:hypothetical protein